MKYTYPSGIDGLKTLTCGVAEMNIISSKPVEALHVYATGRGIHTEIVISYHSKYEKPFDFEMSVDEAKELIKFLEKAMEDAERRKLLPLDNDD